MSRGLNRGNAGPMARAGVASAGGAGARPGPAATRRAPQTALDMRRDASGALRPMFDVADLLHAARVPVLRACKLDDLRDLVAQLEAVCEKADLAAALKSGVAGNDRAAPHHDALSLARAELDRREASRPARAAISFGENSHLAATQHASWGWAFRPQPASLTAGSQGRAQPGGSD